MSKWGLVFGVALSVGSFQPKYIKQGYIPVMPIDQFTNYTLGWEHPTIDTETDFVAYTPQRYDDFSDEIIFAIPMKLVGDDLSASCEIISPSTITLDAAILYLAICKLGAKVSY